MQTDAWLTDTSYPDRCPLCSQPLAGGSNRCPACGFTAHEPAGNASVSAFSGPEVLRATGDPGGKQGTQVVRQPVTRHANPATPIPARASAQRARSRTGVVPRRSQASAATGASAESVQGGGWQHESASYEAASSLSALSLIISETPTAPPRNQHQASHTEQIDEIDTVPQTSRQTRAVPRSAGVGQAVTPGLPETPVPPGSLSLRLNELSVPSLALVLSETTPPVPFTHVDEIDTVPEARPASSQELAPVQVTSREVTVDAASWTAGRSASSSLAARLIASHSPRHRRRRRAFNPLDRTRWWLLRPGRIEFLLWTFGSVLLFGVTFLLLLATVLSAMLPGLQSGGNLPTSSVKASATAPGGTQASTTGLRLTLVGKPSFPSGAEIQLQGDGFHPHSLVVFLLDGRLPLLDQSGKTAAIQTDASGRFAVKLWLGQGPEWSPGSHQVLARESTSGHQAALTITITAPATPASTGNQNTPAAPANPTPTPVRPTATPIRPSPTPTTVPATPTSGTTATPASSPTSGPTRGSTATPVAVGGSATPGQTQGSASLGNALTNEDSNSLFARLAHLNPLVWLIGFCYFISLFLLGLAGVLRRRRH